MDELCKRIRSRRKEMKLTQTDLAVRVGYSEKSSIARIEKGEINISYSKIEDIARVLETTPAYLLGITDNVKPQPITEVDYIVEDFENKVGQLLIETENRNNEAFIKRMLSYSEKLLVEKYREAPQNIKDAINSLLDI